MSAFEIAVFRKANGPLSKHIALKDGKPNPDGSACRMAAGTARRVKLNDMEAFAKLIGNMRSDEAPTLGRLRADLPDSVKVITKKELSSSTPPNVIARTGDYLHFAERAAAFMLLDHDGKQMPDEIVEKLKQLGGFWPAVIAVAPQLASASRVTRRSTSAGIYRKDTHERFPGSTNEHDYIAVSDGTDIERALKTLHDRLWLAGLGYYVVGAIGQLLDRSIIDAAVYGPERLVFEGAPVLVPPLAQNAAVRRPQVDDGQVIDTVQAILALSEEDARRLATLKAEAARRLKPAAAAARRAWAADFAARRGLTPADAERIAAAATDRHILAPEFELEFDDLGLCTVADVLADPDRYVGEALADPLEGTAYGRGKAKVLRRRNGTLMINSYAHGGIKYQLTGQGVELTDFYAYLPRPNSYLFTPTRELWPAESVNACVPPVALTDGDGEPLLDDEGMPKLIAASKWLARHRAVQQMTWAPGFGTPIVEDFLVDNDEWVPRNGARVFNHYQPPRLALGDAARAGPWLDHVHKIYPDDAAHIIKYLAHRVQRPGEKLNHALVLGGAQGIGKDTLLEAVKHAIGHANFHEVLPPQLMGRFNKFLKSVILRVNEARDLGEINRYQFYEHLKTYTAAPPNTLRVDEKNLPEYYIFNCCGVIISTNYKTDGIYLPRDDRRHYVAWSELTKDDFDEAYWNTLWQWYAAGGHMHVAAYLTELDLTEFNAKAPPPKTAAWWAIVDANQAPENAELADILDGLGTSAAGRPERPNAVSLEMIRTGAHTSSEFLLWMREVKNRRAIPHRLEDCGYVPVRNDDAKDGLWMVRGKRQVVYAKADLPLRDRLRAVEELVADRTTERVVPMRQRWQRP